MTGIRTALILAASLLVTAGCGDTGSSGTAQLDPATLETTTYRVDGMHCGGCARRSRPRSARSTASRPARSTWRAVRRSWRLRRRADSASRMRSCCSATRSSRSRTRRRGRPTRGDVPSEPEVSG